MRVSGSGVSAGVGLLRAGLACLALLAVSACALTEQVVPVDYTPSASAEPIATETKAVKLIVEDDRGIYRGQIGAKVNGFGQEMAAIRSSVPVRDIVANAFVEELRLRNMTVDDNLVQAVNVSITAMHNNYQVGLFSGEARGIVAFTVRVTGADGGSLYETAISEVEEIPGIMVFAGENAAKSVGAALDAAMKSLFNDPGFLAALAKT
jgi:hypothetical protein